MCDFSKVILQLCYGVLFQIFRTKGPAVAWQVLEDQDRQLPPGRICPSKPFWYHVNVLWCKVKDSQYQECRYHVFWRALNHPSHSGPRDSQVRWGLTTSRCTSWRRRESTCWSSTSPPSATPSRSLPVSTLRCEPPPADSFPSPIGLFYLSMGWVFALTRFTWLAPQTMCGVYVMLGLAWLIVCAMHWRDILRIQFWIGMYWISRRNIKRFFSARRGDLLGHGGEGNVFSWVPEYKQLRPGEDRNMY